MIGLYTSPLFNSILPERIGYIIQQRRKLLGLTQEQLAGRTHFDRIIHSPIGEKLNGKCYECGNKKYTEWDYKAKKCPQCKDGIINESEGGVLIMAD